VSSVDRLYICLSFNEKNGFLDVCAVHFSLCAFFRSETFVVYFCFPSSTGRVLSSGQYLFTTLKSCSTRFSLPQHDSPSGGVGFISVPVFIPA
jgi:hypothetical protein